MAHLDLIGTRDRERLVEGLGDVARPHRRGQLPRDDVTREVIEHCRQVVPAPAYDPEVREVGLPHLVDAFRRVLERIRGRHQHIGRAGDEVGRLEQAVDARFRHEVAPFLREPAGELTGREVGSF